MGDALSKFFYIKINRIIIACDDLANIILLRRVELVNLEYCLWMHANGGVDNEFKTSETHACIGK